MPTAYAPEGTGRFEEPQQFVIACEEADESFTVICERFGDACSIEEGRQPCLLERKRFEPAPNARCRRFSVPA
jgi:hypothetical protein